MTTLRALECLVAVADTGSVSRAAAALHLSQPALSHQLAALERELGTPVVHRLGRGVRVTAAGHAAAEQARIALRAAEQAVRAGRAVGAGREGRLRIACAETMTAWLLVPVLRQWRHRHPAVLLELTEHTSADRMAQLIANGETDLAIGPRPSLEAGESVGGGRSGADDGAAGGGADRSAGGGRSGAVGGAADGGAADGGAARSDGGGAAAADTSHLVQLGREEVVAVAPTGHPFAGQRAVSLKELSKEPFVHYAPDNGLSVWVDQLAAEHGVLLDPVLRTRSPRTAAQLAAAGMGVAIVPVSALAARPAGVVRPLRPRVLRDVVVLVAAPSDTLAARFVADLRRRGLPGQATTLPSQPPAPGHDLSSGLSGD
jgi:DNA-binding transcriptional LysR family regulator